MLNSVSVDCPYCGENFETAVDCSAGSQIYVEDCPVCCRPIEFWLTLDSTGEIGELSLRRDDD